MVDIFEEGKRKYYIDKNDKKNYITDELGHNLYLTDDFIDISYFSKQSICTALSNLFPYDFIFSGIKVKSVEGVLQSLKHKELEIQRLILNYFGKDAYHTRVASFTDDWRDKGLLYFNGKSLNRFGLEYQVFLNELYLAVYKNPLFAKALQYTDGKLLMHSSGVLDPRETTLTPHEYVDRLMIIRDCTLCFVNPECQLMDLSNDIVASYHDKIYVKK